MECEARCTGVTCKSRVGQALFCGGGFRFNNMEQGVDALKCGLTINRQFKQDRISVFRVLCGLIEIFFDQKNKIEANSEINKIL